MVVCEEPVLHCVPMHKATREVCYCTLWQIARSSRVKLHAFIMWNWTNTVCTWLCVCVCSCVWRDGGTDNFDAGNNTAPTWNESNSGKQIINLIKHLISTFGMETNVSRFFITVRRFATMLRPPWWRVALSLDGSESSQLVEVGWKIYEQIVISHFVCLLSEINAVDSLTGVSSRASDYEHF